MCTNSDNKNPFLTAHSSFYSSSYWRLLVPTTETIPVPVIFLVTILGHKAFRIVKQLTFTFN